MCSWIINSTSTTVGEKLVWTGNNDTPEWNGEADQGFIINPDETTNGTYFYSLELNDADYPEPLYGYLFLSE